MEISETETEISGRGMACGTRTIHPGGRNKAFGSIFRSPEEGRSVQWPRRRECDSKDDNSPNNVNRAN